MGDLTQSAKLYTQALPVHRHADNWKVAALQMRELGEVHHLLGNLDKADRLLTEAMALHRQIGDRVGETEARLCLAALQRDRATPALAPVHTALADAKELGDSNTEINALNCLASNYLSLGHHRQALEFHEVALRKANDVGSPHLRAEALIGLAAAHHALGDSATAKALLTPAVTIAEKRGYRLLHAQALTLLTDLHLTGGCLPSAAESGHRAIEIHQETGHRLGEARVHVLLGHRCQHNGDTRGSDQHLTRAHVLLIAVNASRD
jgi:tetratricopeptide (TPR) repeat protein